MTPWTLACCQPPLSTGFSRQEYRTGLSFPSLGDLPHPGIKPESTVPPALVDGFFTTEPPGKPYPPAVTPFSHFPQLLAITNPPSILVDWPLLDIPGYKRNHTV